MSGRALFGYRTDVDLNQRWWHRLMKVVYVVAFCLLVAFAGVLLSDVDPPLNRANIRTTKTLAEAITEKDRRGNIVEHFRSLPGRLGVLRPDGSIGDTGLYDVWCSSNPAVDADAIAEYLNKGEYANARTNTAETVLASVRTVSPGDLSKPLCWQPNSNEKPGWPNVIKYEFTGAAEIKHRLKQFGYTTIVGFLFHALMANLYYRGLVYVVIGPSRKTTPD